MKKSYYLLLVLLLSLASCVSRQSAEKLTDSNDSLSMVVAQKDSTINDIFSSLSTVTENLNAIKTRENLINDDIDGDGEIAKNDVTRINEDIESINQLLIQNRQTIEKLEKNAAQLKKANIKIGSLERLINQLKEQVSAKDKEIADLRQQLADKNIQVAELNEKVTGLNTQVSTLSTEKSSLEGEVKTQGDIMNKGYYIVGAEKELLAKEIVYKSGFIGRTLKINENRSLDSFTQIDIRNFDEVLIGHKKPTIVSSHPSGSYQLLMNDDGTVKALKITDKDKFWGNSKVLVISYNR